MSAGINKALAFIRRKPDAALQRGDLAAIAGQSTSAFSRAFRQHTGMSLVQYVKRLRINLACQILMSDEQAPITEHLLRGRLQQSIQFQPAVPGREGHDAVAVPAAAGSTISRPRKAA